MCEASSLFFSHTFSRGFEKYHSRDFSLDMFPNSAAFMCFVAVTVSLCLAYKMYSFTGPVRGMLVQIVTPQNDVCQQASSWTAREKWTQRPCLHSHLSGFVHLLLLHKIEHFALTPRTCVVSRLHVDGLLLAGAACWSGLTLSSHGSGRQELSGAQCSLAPPLFCHCQFVFLFDMHVICIMHIWSRALGTPAPTLSLSLSPSPLSLIFLDSCWYFLLFGFLSVFVFPSRISMCSLTQNETSHCDWSRKTGYSDRLWFTLQIVCSVICPQVVSFYRLKTRTLSGGRENYLLQW